MQCETRANAMRNTIDRMDAWWDVVDGTVTSVVGAKSKDKLDREMFNKQFDGCIMWNATQKPSWSEEGFCVCRLCLFPNREEDVIVILCVKNIVVLQMFIDV